MDGDRKPCNRATCGNKGKCAHLNKATNRTPQLPNARPGAADQIKQVASPFVGAGATSTQILYVEPNFSETPSEYDIFYDCYSDEEINQPQIASKNAIITKKGRGGGGPIGSTPPTKDSKMFRDALKQVIVNAQALLVEFDSGGRGGRRGCGSRCRCDVRNIKPQSRTVQLEVTAKVAANKTTPPPNIRIDPITFTIPLKLHLQGQNQQSQQNISYTPSQQSYEGRRVNERDYGMQCMFNSMEPIRTAIITGTRPEAANCMHMGGPVPAFDFPAAFIQQMTGIQPGLLQFPMPGVEEFSMLPQAQLGTSKLQIQVPTPPPLMTLGRPADLKMSPSKSKSNCGEVCSVSQQQAPSVDPFITPSLAPVNKGNFLATIAKSSTPSVAPTKSQQLSETGSRGVCVICGRGGDCAKMQPETSNKGPCTMCAKGKSTPAPAPIQTMPAAAPQMSGAASGKCSNKREDEHPTVSLVVLVPPQPSEGQTKRGCKICPAGAPPATQIKQAPYQKDDILKGPCGMCTRGAKAAPPKPPPLEEPLIKVKGPCGICTKNDTKPMEPKPKILTPTIPPDTKPSGGPCGACSVIRAAPKAQQSQQLPVDAGRSRCVVCGTKVEQPAKLDKGLCGHCAAKAAPAVMVEAAPPMEAAKASCSTRAVPSMDVQKGASAICTHGETGTNKESCDICSKGMPPPAVVGRKADCAICSKATTTLVTIQKAPCGVCGRGPAPSTAELKAPCGVCGRGVSAPAIEQKAPCGVCGRGVSAPAIEQKAPCGVCGRGAAPSTAELKAPCGVCGRGVSAPAIEQKAPCGVCGRGVSAPAIEQKAPCGVCGRGAAPSTADLKAPCRVCGRGVTPPALVDKGPCGVCGRGAEPSEMIIKGPCGVCSKPATAMPPPPAEKAPCGICSRGAEPATSIVEKGPCGVCSRSAAPTTPAVEKGPCGVCSRGAAPPPLVSEKGPCGVCSRGAAPPPPVPEKGPCGICAIGATPPAVSERAPCEARTSPSAPSVMSVHKQPCDICSRAAAPQQQLARTAPCNICKKGPIEASPALCKICKKVRASPEQPPLQVTTKKEPCDICSKLTGPSSAPSDITPCGKCGAVGAPCGMCSQQATYSTAPSTAAVSSNVTQTCGKCFLPIPPQLAPQAASCLGHTQPTTPSTTCGTCLTSKQQPSSSSPPPPPPPVIDYNCGTCLLPKPKEICSCFLEIGPKYYKALPQHKDIHICSPCRYDPSPLIDQEGKVFCPYNCGCCLCPWRKRGTDSQIDQIKHEKIKVCKCRAKGSIFMDYTSRAKCSNTSYFDCCPCRERAEAKYLEMFGEEMWTPNEKLREKVRGEPVRMEDVVEYKRASTTG